MIEIAAGIILAVVILAILPGLLRGAAVVVPWLLGAAVLGVLAFVILGS